MLRRSRSLVFKHKHAPGNSTTLASASCATRPAFHHRLATEHPSAGLLITARGDSEHRVGEHKQSRSWGGAAYSSVSQPHSHTPGGIGHPPNKSHPAMAGVAGERTYRSAASLRCNRYLVLVDSSFGHWYFTCLASPYLLLFPIVFSC